MDGSLIPSDIIKDIPRREYICTNNLFERQIVSCFNYVWYIVKICALLPLQHIAASMIIVS